MVNPGSAGERGHGRSTTDGLSYARPLEQACDQLARRLDASSWPQLLDEGGHLEHAWSKVAHLLHDAVHHLRMVDGILEGAIPALVDVDLDAGTYNCADG